MNQLLAVFVYESRRALRPGRIGWWFALAAFPVLITLLIRSQPEFALRMPQQQVDNIWAFLFYMLIPCVCCGLGCFLNAAPAVASELEQRSWVYLATRPHGILWLLSGRYLVAVVWSLTSAITGVTIALLATEMAIPVLGIPPAAAVVSPAAEFPAETIVQRGQEPAAATFDDGMQQGPGSRFQVLFRLWFTMARLSLLSSMSYGALFLLIGAIFPKRAMVFCVLYTALVELVLSLIPAIINRLTIQYRLRSLMMNWAEPEGRDQLQNNVFFRYVFAEGSNMEQILWLAATTILFLTAAILVAQRSEFTGAAESDL